MSHTAVLEYIDLLSGDEKAKLALFACSVALSLDDDVAREAIGLVTKSNGSTESLLRRIKKLGCVWTQWDGTWYIAENIRPYLFEYLSESVPVETQLLLRNRLAEFAENRAKTCSPDGQITAFRKRRATFEAAYQRTLIPDQTEKGAQQLTELWKQSSFSVAQATAEAVDYIAPEIDRQLKFLPVEVLFLRGMAARARKDKEGQLKHFGAVWEKGRPGEIFGIAAHFFGLLVRDKSVAERALRDSIKWNADSQDQGHVYHSLGNLLSKDRNRRTDAKNAYEKGLQLLTGPQDQAEVYHSLGNLLSKDRNRRADAENAYEKSLKLRTDPQHQGQVYHSLGNLLSKDKNRRADAKNAYDKSIELRIDPQHQAAVYHSLGNLLSKDRNRRADAENAYEKSLELDKIPQSQAETYHSLGNLLSKDRNRRASAEKAYGKSIDLRTDEKDKGQVLASWANFLSKIDDSATQDLAVEKALDSLKLDPADPWTNGVCYRILAEIYERKGELGMAIENYALLIDADKKLKEWDFVKKIELKIAKLRKLL